MIILIAWEKVEDIDYIFHMGKASYSTLFSNITFFTFSEDKMRQF